MLRINAICHLGNVWNALLISSDLSKRSVEDRLLVHGLNAACKKSWKVLRLTGFFVSDLICLSPCCLCPDPGRGTVFKAASVAEPQRHRVDLPASRPLAHGPQLRTPYPRIHCPKHRWRTAAKAGEP